MSINTLGQIFRKSTPTVRGFELFEYSADEEEEEEEENSKRVCAVMHRRYMYYRLLEIRVFYFSTFIVFFFAAIKIIRVRIGDTYFYTIVNFFLQK